MQTTYKNWNRKTYSELNRKSIDTNRCAKNKLEPHLGHFVLENKELFIL